MAPFPRRLDGSVRLQISSLHVLHCTVLYSVLMNHSRQSYRMLGLSLF